MLQLRKRVLLVLVHPLAQLGVGVAMMACGVGELVSDLGEVALDATPGAAHGVVLFGALHAVKSLLEFLEGFEKIEIADGDEASIEAPAEAAEVTAEAGEDWAA
ncbi:MAG: hypothetical protein R3F59_18195 [Myxococcota bacterium]